METNISECIRFLLEVEKRCDTHFLIIAVSNLILKIGGMPGIKPKVENP